MWEAEQIPIHLCALTGRSFNGLGCWTVDTAATVSSPIKMAECKFALRPKSKEIAYSTVLRDFGFALAASYSATAFWSFSASTRWRLAASMRTTKPNCASCF